MLCEYFVESWLNTEHTVLGHKLKPYCLYYNFWLQVIESPLVNGRSITWVDLSLATEICRSEYDRFKVPKPTLWRNFRLGLRNVGRNLQGEVDSFVEYVDDFYSPPKFWTPIQKGGGGVPIGPPPEMLDIAASCIEMGFTEREAWMMPLGRAYWYAAIAKNKSGGLNFETPKDRAIMKRIRAMREAKAKAEAEAAAQPTQSDGQGS